MLFSFLNNKEVHNHFIVLIHIKNSTFTSDSQKQTGYYNELVTVQYNDPKTRKGIR